MGTNIYKALLLLTLILLSNSAVSQTSDLLKEATGLHQSYRFEEALDKYDSLLLHTEDSIIRRQIEESIIQCENGLSLLQYSVTPDVFSMGSFPKKDFYLHISGIEDKSWVQVPNQMIQDKTHPYYSAVYFPEGAKTIYYSAPDNSGSWNIYQITQVSDTLWSAPKILGENITSSGDEIFPMVSSDGKELYFASNGHYGMGGYDLYVSHWDEESQDWGMPENLGFPFSSTADDIFYFITPDGSFSVLASNRDSSDEDILSLFALEYTPTPVRRELSDVVEIQKIAKLEPPKLELEEIKEIEEQSAEEDNGMGEYSQLVSQMRQLSKEFDENLTKQNENRDLYYSITNEDDKKYIAQVITELEQMAIEIRSRLEEAKAAVQDAEMNFLAKGIIPHIQEEKREAPSDMGDVKVYKFSNYTYKEPVEMNIEVPEPQFDFSFKILDEAQIVEDSTLPEGLVYQIQLMVTSTPASLKSLKGLSPVFERKQPSGKYLYTVGLWSKHSEALSCLNQVRKKGFPKAYIVAYNDGKSLSVKNARTLENKIRKGDGDQTYQVLLNGFPEGIPSPILTAIRQACDKDLAKSVINGQTIYMVGPFSNMSEAEKLKSLLLDLGVEGITIDTIKK